MSIVASVKLDSLSTDSSRSTSAILKLHEWANGPLRLEKKSENGVTVHYLGVRSWSTYFFEKLIATDKQKADARRETMVAIEKYVRPFLNEHDVTTGSRFTSEEITECLYSKVTRQPAKSQQVKGTMPTFKAIENFNQASAKSFHGITRVPEGITIGVCEPLRIIADVHLVRKASPESCLMGDLKKGLIRAQNGFRLIENMTVKDFEQKYLSVLNNEKRSIRTSVVLELQLDSEGHCSDANLQGARRAAERFLDSQNTDTKNISIMLIVPKVPVGDATRSKGTPVPDSKAKISSQNRNQGILVAENSEENPSSEEFSD